MDVRGNKVKLDDDTEISYDKCLIATGQNLQTSFHDQMWLQARLVFTVTETAVFRWSAKKSPGG